MSVRFYAKILYALDAAVGTYLHKNSIVCVDIDGNWYYHCSNVDPELRNKKNWPRREAKGIPLYRDYWRHIAAHKDSPLMDELLKAPKTQII